MFEKHCFVGILMVSDENSLIRIHTKMSWIRNTDTNLLQIRNRN
jgi:hypothetical protein